MGAMLIHYDARCAEYAAPGHPDAPFRVLNTAALLREKHPGWFPPEGAETVPPADDATLRLAPPPAYLARLRGMEGIFTLVPKLLLGNAVAWEAPASLPLPLSTA